MPPLIVWGVGVLGGAALVRWAIKEVQRINRELEDARLARMAESMQTERIPTLRRDHFRKWFAQHRKKAVATENKIILWDDCFTTFTEPEIGIAAVTLIEALGYSVELAEPICCGRPLISKGYLTEARNLVQKQASALYRRLERYKL